MLVIFSPAAGAASAGEAWRWRKMPERPIASPATARIATIVPPSSHARLRAGRGAARVALTPLPELVELESDS